MRLDEITSERHSGSAPERMAVLAARFPGSHRAITRECRLDKPVWLALLDALCLATPVKPARLAAALGEATKSFPFVGGESDAPTGTEYARLVRRSAVSADMFRALSGAEAEADAAELHALVDGIIEDEDADRFQAELGDKRLSRYPMWATFPEQPGERLLADPTASSEDWLRLGLSPDVPRRMVAMWYELPGGQASHVPTICNAFAGASQELNGCFQPADEGMLRGKTVRCTNVEAVDGLPEVVHPVVTARSVTAISARNRAHD